MYTVEKSYIQYEYTVLNSANLTSLNIKYTVVGKEQGWEFAHSLIALLLIRLFAQIAQIAQKK